MKDLCMSKEDLQGLCVCCNKPDGICECDKRVKMRTQAEICMNQEQCVTCPLNVNGMC